MQRAKVQRKRAKAVCGVCKVYRCVQKGAKVVCGVVVCRVVQRQYHPRVRGRGEGQGTDVHPSPTHHCPIQTIPSHPNPIHSFLNNTKMPERSP